MKKLRGGHVVLLIASFITIILAAPVYLGVEVPILHTLELKSRDLRFRIRGAEKPSGDVVIVAIDDRSIDAMGRWPWPRFTIARTIELLKEGGAKAVALDLLLSEPESNPELARIRKLVDFYTELGLLNESPGNQAFFDELIESAEVADNDAMLASISRKADNVVYSMALTAVKKNSDPAGPAVMRNSLPPNIASDAVRPAGFPGGIFPIPELAEAAAKIGFANVDPDPDGSVRRGIAVARHGSGLFASLPLCAVQLHQKPGNSDFELTDGNLGAGPHSLPLNSEGQFHIFYYGPDYTIPYYSFADVLTGHVQPDVFKGKCVFIGGAAVGLGDHWASPFSENFWGVELQATIADNILSKRFYRRPSKANLVDALLVIAAGCIAALFLSRLPIVWCAPFSGIAVVCFLVADQYVFNRYNCILNCVFPLMNIIFTGACVCLYRYVAEGRQNRILKNALNQYLNPSVVSRILKNPEYLMLGGNKKFMTVLFSDIRGFTSISEKLEPETLVALINRYLTLMTDIIMECEGTLDKYIGDAVMAFFGAPEDQRDHAVRACRTALAMMDALTVERAKWLKEGLPRIYIGIGINTGDMVVGNMGSEKRFDYTVIGDHVNLSARLESLTKVYGVKVLVSEFTHGMVEDMFMFRELDYVRVVGREKPAGIFELIGKDYYSNGEYAYISPFEEGLRAYRNREFDKAVRFFEKTLEIKPKDTPSVLFIERCRDLVKNPPDESWDGVFSAHAK